MNPRFERDARYPWSVVLRGEHYAPENLETGERLTVCQSTSYQAADRGLDSYLEGLDAGVTPRDALTEAAAWTFAASCDMGAGRLVPV